MNKIYIVLMGMGILLVGIIVLVVAYVLISQSRRQPSSLLPPLLQPAPFEQQNLFPNQYTTLTGDTQETILHAFTDQEITVEIDNYQLVGFIHTEGVDPDQSALLYGRARNDQGSNIWQYYSVYLGTEAYITRRTDYAEIYTRQLGSGDKVIFTGAITTSLEWNVEMDPTKLNTYRLTGAW